MVALVKQRVCFKLVLFVFILLEYGGTSLRFYCGDLLKPLEVNLTTLWGSPDWLPAVLTLGRCTPRLPQSISSTSGFPALGPGAARGQVCSEEL